jgi:hypothetical protein
MLLIIVTLIIHNQYGLINNLIILDLKFFNNIKLLI